MRILRSRQQLDVCLTCLRQLSTTSKYNTQHQWHSKVVRKTFTDFFVKEHGHLIVPSSSVLPKKGEGTYFVNAGMNQFKQIFLGNPESGNDFSGYQRVTNSQKCVRVGGKHNDLDDVGHDVYHHTFFEMLGSWSFGDYFKKEACSMALELLTKVYGLPMDRLYFTYFGGDDAQGLMADEECREIWFELGVPPENLLPGDTADNFWDMGAVGPCGPSSEIHYDHVGTKDARDLVNKDNDSVIELWNLVFMQYNRQLDQSLIHLPNVHADTGAGLERLTAVLQNKTSNYDTDLFQPLFDRIQKETGVPKYQGLLGSEDQHGIDTAYRIIADHTRMTSVAISDGLMPGRRDLHHKLRVIIDRAVHQSRFVLKAEPYLMSKLVEDVAESLGEAYPEIIKQMRKIKYDLNQEEDRYMNIYEDGIIIMEKLMKKLNGVKFLPGEVLVGLSEGQYGTPIPLDIVQILSHKFGLRLDTHAFDQHLQVKREESFLDRINKKEGEIYLDEDSTKVLKDKGTPPTDDSHKYSYLYDGAKYDFSPCNMTNCKIVGIVDGQTLVDSVSEGQSCGIILDKTGFYSEAGGQASDFGVLTSPSGTFKVESIKSYDGYVLHIGAVESGKLSLEETLDSQIDQGHRLGCMQNHTATHLLNSVLKEVISKDVKQESSVVDNMKLTFDFSYRLKLTDDLINKVEQRVKEMISKNLPVQNTQMSYSDATSDESITFLQNENYPTEVSVVTVGDNVSAGNTKSAELCCGTHVHNTGDIGDFVVTHAKGVSQGIKAISAVTGEEAKLANKNAEEICQLFTELETLVKDECPAHIIVEKEKFMYKMLYHELVPKSVRADYSTKVAVLGMKISELKHKEHIKELTQIISGFEKDDRPFILETVDFDNAKRAGKALDNVAIHKPCVLFNELPNDETCVLLCFPKTIKKPTGPALTNQISALFKESRHKHLKTKRHHEITAITLRTTGIKSKVYATVNKHFK